MLRAVLAVLVAAALLGLSMPVVDSARVSHADSQVQSELADLEAVAADLRAESDPTPPGVPGARVERTLVLPPRSWGNAGIAQLTLPDSADTPVRWHVPGGETRTVRPSPPLVAPPAGLELHEPGPHRLELSLQRRGGRSVVVVSRADV